MISGSWFEHRLFPRLTWAFLMLNAGLFCLLLTLIGSLQQPTGDDLLYLKFTLDSGPWNSTMEIRENWNTRWASVLTNQTLFYIIPRPRLGLTYQLITLVLGTLAFLPISKLILGVGSGLLRRLALAIFMLLLLYLFTFGAADSWFWLCATPAYLWSGFAAVLVLSLMSSSTNAGSILIGGPCSIYAGGSAEVISFSLLVAFASLLIFRKKLGRINQTLLLLFGICLIFSMFFGLLGDGAVKRFDALGHPSFIEGVFLGLKNYIKVIFYGIGSKLGIAFLAAATLFSLRNKTQPKPILGLKFSLGLADLILILTTMMFAFIMNELGPNRAYLHISISLLLLVLITVISIRPNAHLNKLFPAVGLIFNLGVSAWLLHLISVELPEQKRFSEALNQRNGCIQEQLNDNQKVIHVSPLMHESTFLYHQELSENPDHWANQQLSTFYGQELEFVLDTKGKFGC